MYEWPDLSPALGELPWAVIGGVATRLYMPERATSDLDIMVDVDAGGEARGRLSAAGYIYRQDLPTVGGSIWDSPEGVEVDVLLARETWVREALPFAHLNRDAQGLPIMPLAPLLLIKFRAGRVQDVADVSRMLGLASDEEVAEARALFAAQEPTAADDFESLLTLGRLESQG